MAVSRRNETVEKDTITVKNTSKFPLGVGNQIIKAGEIFNGDWEERRARRVVCQCLQ